MYVIEMDKSTVVHIEYFLALGLTLFGFIENTRQSHVTFEQSRGSRNISKQIREKAISLLCAFEEWLCCFRGTSDAVGLKLGHWDLIRKFVYANWYKYI